MSLDQDTENQNKDDAPDFLSRIWQWVYQRRTVQIALAYLAAGFAILEFLDITLRGSESADLVLGLARLFYLLGFLLIVFAAPLIFTGTHYFRTGLIAGIVGISLITGILVRGQFEPVSTSDPVVEPAANQLSPTNNDDTAPPVENTANTQSIADVDDTQEQLDTPEISQDSVETEPQTVSNQPVTQELSSLDRLLVIYGESDRVVLDTSTRGQALFGNSNAAIELRFYSVSGGQRFLNVEPIGSRRAERLEFPRIRSTASTIVQVETECGQLEYLVEATRIGDREAEVTGRINLERSRGNVERAEALGQCNLQ